MRAAICAPLLAAVTLAGCDNSAPEPDAESTEIPEELQGRMKQEPATAEVSEDVAEAENAATPMAERLVTLGLVNKRNNISQDIEMYPGESRRAGDVILRVEACERTAPWEDGRLTGAFVQVFVNEREAGGDTQWNGVFSGWLYKESPSVNVVEHPIYDVWVKDCAMSFPGEEEPVSDS